MQYTEPPMNADERRSKRTPKPALCHSSVEPRFAAKRRELLLAGAGTALLPRSALSQGRREVTDAAGRKVALPARIERIYAAGPPAGILVFAVVPDKLIGWTNPWRDAEKPFIARRYADLPALGRLTGRGNTANVEVVLAAKPDFMVDYGTGDDNGSPSSRG